jgi:hypothetical protein
MRFRKSAIILIAAVILMAAVLIFFDARLLEKIKQTSQTQDGPQPEEQTVIDGGTDTSGNAGPDEAPSENDAGTDDEASADELAASENVRVEYNSPEYDIEVTLCENTEKKTFLRLKYYTDGISTVHELYEEQIRSWHKYLKTGKVQRMESEDHRAQRSRTVRFPIYNKPGITEPCPWPVVPAYKRSAA